MNRRVQARLLSQSSYLFIAFSVLVLALGIFLYASLGAVEEALPIRTVGQFQDISNLLRLASDLKTELDGYSVTARDDYAREMRYTLNKINIELKLIDSEYLGKIPQDLSVLVADITRLTSEIFGALSSASPLGETNAVLYSKRADHIYLEFLDYVLRSNNNTLRTLETQGDNINRVKFVTLFSLLAVACAAFLIVLFLRMQKVLIAQLEESERKAIALSEAKSEFLANMSHEIRTPMNAILGMAYLALRTSLDQQQRDYVTKIHQASESLLGIINDILDFSKIEAGKMELEAIPVDVASIFSRVGSIVTLKAEQKGIEILFSVDPRVPAAIIADPLRIEQILINLVNNAVKFTEKGTILLAVEPTAEAPGIIELTFSVTDTGIGMDSESIERIFDPFGQANSSISRRYGGTGLGLSIVKNLAGLMHGTLNVESTAGKGSRFSLVVTFPSVAIGSQPGLPIPGDLRGLRVLVVDDNPIACETISAMLSSFSFRVTSVISGALALAELDREHYSLVILDWLMPDIDGLETARRIVKSGKSPRPPAILMVSAAGGIDIQRQAAELGILEFLAKPILPSSLFDSIMRAMGVAERLPLPDALTVASVKDGNPVQGACVLLVEDNLVNQQVATEILRQGGVAVDVVNNGRDAVERIAGEHCYEMIFMDIQMPVMDGYEATDRIKRLKNGRDVPIVAMTASAMAGEREKCLMAGMCDYVSKPINPDELFAKLALWIRTTDRAKGISAFQSHKDTPKDPFSQQTLPGINVKDALAQLGGNSKLLERIIMEFSDSVHDTVKEIDRAMEINDTGKIRSLIHTMKANLGSIGADSAYETAIKLDEILRDKNDKTVVSSYVGMLVTELNKVIDAAEILRMQNSR